MSSVMISLPEEFLHRVDKQAEYEDRTRSELIREALRMYIKINSIKSKII